MATIRANTQLFDEVLDFLTSTPAPEQIIAFEPSEGLQERVRYLLDAKRNGTLVGGEKAELDDFARTNYFMSMLKIRARKKLAGE